jgi:hypothetical protein
VCQFDANTNGASCGAKNCTLADTWGAWSECSVSCGGGTQSREKQRLADATNGGTCSGETQERSCQRKPCDSEEVSLGVEEKQDLTDGNDNDITDRAISYGTYDGEPTIYTGARHLFVLNASTLLNTIPFAGDGTPRTHVTVPREADVEGEHEITALVNDELHVYVASKWQTDGLVDFKVQRMDKATATFDTAWKYTRPKRLKTGYGSIISMTQSSTHLYAGLSHNTACTVIRIAKADAAGVAGTHSSTTYGQPNALVLEGNELMFGTWKGNVGIATLTGSFGANFRDAETIYEGAVPIVQIKKSLSYLFASTDDQNANAAGHVYRLSLERTNWPLSTGNPNPIGGENTFTLPSSSTGAKQHCTAMVLDWARLFCGTDRGSIIGLPFKSADLSKVTPSVISSADVVSKSSAAAPAKFYAAAIGNNNMYAVSYGDDNTDRLGKPGSYVSTNTASAVYRIEGPKSPVDCVWRAWSTWGNCTKDDQGMDNPFFHQRTYNMTYCYGVKKQARQVKTHAMFGGKECENEWGDGPEMKQVEYKRQRCELSAQECCTKQGKVWSSTEWHVACPVGQKTATVTSANQGVLACRCPFERPVLKEDGTCISQLADEPCIAKLQATKCDAISCEFIPLKSAGQEGTYGPERIVVRHHQASITSKFKFGSKPPQHQCIHSFGRMAAGCTCLCWGEAQEWEEQSEQV